MEVEEIVGIKLPDELRHLVGGVQADGRIVLLKGHLRVEPINSAPRGGVDEPVHVDQLGILEDLQNSEAVHHQVLLGVVDGVLVGEVGCEVEDVIGLLLEDPLQHLVVEDAPLDEGNVICL